MKGIVLEGPDGAGKTTLAKELLVEFPKIEMIERPANSLTGGLPNRDEWVEWHLDRVVITDHPTLTDRHPMISEYIYGPITREALFGHFSSPQWTYDQLHKMYRRCIVIWCLPPLDVVTRNTIETPQMPGVLENIGKLWHAYSYARHLWSGFHTTYDYTKSDALPGLKRYLNKHHL